MRVILHQQIKIIVSISKSADCSWGLEPTSLPSTGGVESTSGVSPPYSDIILSESLGPIVGWIYDGLRMGEPVGFVVGDFIGLSVGRLNGIPNFQFIFQIGKVKYVLHHSNFLF